MRDDGDRSGARRQVDLPRGRVRAVATGLVAALGAVGVVAAVGGCSATDATVGSAGPVELAGSPFAAPSAGLVPGADDRADAAAVPTPVTVPVPPTARAAAAARVRPSTRTVRPGATTARTGSAKVTPSRTGTAKPGAGQPATGTASPGAVAGAPLLLGLGTESVAEAEVVRLVNVQRTAAGCQPVVADPVLVRLARAHSQDMAGAAGFKHNGSDGRTPFQRMTAAGYDYSVAAENIAAGQPNAGAVMAAWTASPGHQANILDCRFTEIGVGVVNVPGTPYVVYWTQEFGAPM